MQRKNGKLISPAQYARLRGLNRSTVSRQIRDGKIPTVGGLIDPRAADSARETNLDGTRKEQAARRKAERTAEEAVLPPATSAEFDSGARWLAGELCVSARRVWPKFVGNLDMAIFPEEQRSAVRGLFVAIQTHLLERWVADFVDDTKLPPIDWAACFGAADAEHIRIECEQLQTSWKRTD